ncbi:MAG: esterase [Sandaracinaceae bacterium]|nr:esterase [Sandaracinaceae bacterium]
MKEERFGGLLARVVGGTDRAGSGTGPVVVLMHGFGAPGYDLVGLASALDVPNDTRFVFPEAPTALGGAYGEGRAWWKIDMEAIQRAMMMGQHRDFVHEDPSELPALRASIKALLSEVKEKMQPSVPVFLGGFSQGAMLATDIALMEPSIELSGLILLSGTLLAEKRWTLAMPARKGLRVLQSHGTHDPMLPFPLAERLRDHMTEAGMHVNWIAFRGQHEIPPNVLAGASAFIRSAEGR